ncbi:MAG TPA: glycosyltransferase family 4 protein [Bryobacteraceae bacterium]|jgi:glycosyltransferase involved in cell wall biosynthesis
MNILFIDQFGEMGGGQQCLVELMPAIAERGWHSFAAVPADGGLAQRLAQLGAVVETISLGDYSPGAKNTADFARFLMAAPRLALQLRSMIRRHRMDLVYANGPRVLPAAAIAAGRLPLIFHAHNYLAPGAGRRLVRGALRIAANANVIAVSRFVASYFGAVPNVQVVPNGVADCGVLTNKPRPFTVGLAGRIAPEKGQLDFVEAARLLPRDWKFLIAGTPILAAPAYAELVRQRADGLPVQFLGWQNDLRQFYGQLDLLAVPSAPGEGFGRVIIEAFSAGVPVVAYDSGGIGELIEDGVTGFLVRPQTPDALAARLREACEDPTARRAIAARGRALWEWSYTIEHYRDRVTSIIARAATTASNPAMSSTGR